VTPLPLSVVNTHYHFDHIGGNHEFEEIAIHEIGAPLIEQPVPRDLSTLTSTTLSGSSTRCRPIASSTQSTFGCSRARVSRVPSPKALMDQRGRSSRRRRRRRWSPTTGSTSAGEC
jgi:phosphoribosyl 1,2-cyclic phosphodiesterase